MLDIQMFGLNGGAHHLVSVLLHTVNTLLLFGLLHSATGALGRSAFVAGMFASHPLHVESVAWVAERKDVLSTLFWLLTLYAYIRYVRRPVPGRYLAMLMMFALGLMAKPMLVTLPFVLLLLDYWPLGRVAPGANRSVWLSLAREKLPLFALALASSVVTFMVQHQQGAVAALDALPLESRAENAVVSYFGYIAHLVWPTRLAVFYPLNPALPGWEVAGCILGLIGVSIAVIAARGHRYLAVGWMWYVGTLIPVIGLIQVGEQSMADRYTYIPLIGLFLMVAWGMPELLGDWPYGRIVVPAVAALGVGACMIVARMQVEYWKSDFALWEHAALVTEGNYIAHNNLGVALANQEKRSEAAFHFSEAVRLKPNYAEAHNNLGLALASQGNTAAAIPQYSEALRIRPGFAVAHDNLAKALSAQGKFDEAIAQFTEVVHLKPDSAVALANLAAALANQGKIDEAIARYTDAVRIQPNFAEAHNNLGFALAGQGKVDAAIREFEAALRVQPNAASIHYDLGVMLNRKGDIPQAILQFEAALKLNPGYPEAQTALDSLRSRSRAQ
jgi:tetratricopeptide (TPR) repeat protein